ncbi:L-aspartate oxidase [Ephemeroptericola cinctiostellae]|uniref:L-aspartate oxidase n=1 Tax=Ephemeroptericola cinctiostellae TaxID=2268024 RepID=A0A345DCK3_9BURK|nr:L-aspartate oxidase [Ephemeroptericola cinctiostellae]AXF86091.1 L-aspartate oxidase [Ephemeroptericola cinctiostellae]
MQQQYDVVIVGSGLAGMSAALSLAPSLKVALLSKGQLLSGSSDWAQGGIAAVMGADDSIDNHYDDTMVAGAQLGEADAVRFVVENAPAAINWLIDEGVPFTREEGHLHLTREGGHSHRRIVHAADATGHAIQSTLIEKVRAHKNITVLEHHIAVDLVTGKHVASQGEVLSGSDMHRCYGVYALDNATGQIHALGAAHTLLATGGAGKVYLYTTNPDSASGDGIAMAWRAGCRVANMEFMQFHPTCLFHPHAKSFLISEALRGEGGILRLPAKIGEPTNSGYRFMFDHDERGELAPRDVVARAIDFEIKKHGLDCVVLDMTHKEPEFLQEHFPMIFARCLELGIDMRTTPIPVVPATHYTCGGVVTDLSGKTDLANLYAIGEVTYTGLHGANRLASNSLLECVVFGQAAARDILAQTAIEPRPLPAWDESRVTNADEEVVISHNWDELRRFMWNYVGIVRTNKRLERAGHRIELLKGEINEFYKNFRVTADLIELRNLVTCADLIVKCASYRHESRGLHYSLDYPNTAPKAMPTVLSPKV